MSVNLDPRLAKKQKIAVDKDRQPRWIEELLQIANDTKIKKLDRALDVHFQYKTDKFVKLFDKLPFSILRLPVIAIDYCESEIPDRWKDARDKCKHMALNVAEDCTQIVSLEYGDNSDSPDWYINVISPLDEAAVSEIGWNDTIFYGDVIVFGLGKSDEKGIPLRDMLSVIKLKSLH